MTPEQRDLVLGLVVAPGSSETISPQTVLSAFGVKDGVELSRRLLHEAVESRSATEVEMAMITASVFGVADDFVDPLIELAYAEWHHSHEDVVWILGRLAPPRAVSALRRAVEWIPAYLEFDDSRALAVKAIHSLGRVPGVEATQALAELSLSEVPSLAAVAQAQLRRRQ